MNITDRPLIFKGYIAKEISLTENPEFKNDSKIAQLEIPIEMQFGLLVKLKNENKHLVAMKCEVFKDTPSSPIQITVELEGEFEFSQQEELDKDSKTLILKSEAVKILFPYIRMTVSQLTALAQLNTLNLPILEFRTEALKEK